MGDYIIDTLFFRSEEKMQKIRFRIQSGLFGVILVISLTLFISCGGSGGDRDEDGDTNTATYYEDSDGDGYGNSSVSDFICPTAGWVADNTDCYDSNEDAYPSSATCGSTDRGDGSYDYNCNSSETTCGTIYNRSATPTSTGYEGPGGGCPNMYCTVYYNNVYNTAATPACGATGGICTATNSRSGGDCDCIDDCGTGDPGDTECYMASWGTTGLCSAISSGAQGCQ